MDLFELIVSNPPYSIKWAGEENPLLINDPSFAPMNAEMKKIAVREEKIRMEIDKIIAEIEEEL